jgi:class 3 adenylate cyclase
MASRKTSVAVLFADVSDSTRIYESLGDTTAFGKVRTVIGLLKGITETFRGRVVKTIGDGLMCVFPTADLAATAAGEMQAGVAQLPPIEGGRKLTLRAGYHFGPVIQDGEDVFGDSVNVAARMADLALAGQVLTTGETEATLSHHIRGWVRRLDAIPVKGKVAAVEVYEQLWQINTDATKIAGGPGTAVPAVNTQIRVVYHGRELTFNNAIQFGREPAADLVVVAGPMISRRHAKIERRGQKFVLLDLSSNGTYVTLGTDPEIRLHREELVLHGSGIISFGQSTSAPGTETVEFHCS